MFQFYITIRIFLDNVGLYSFLGVGASILEGSMIHFPFNNIISKLWFFDVLSGLSSLLLVKELVKFPFPDGRLKQSMMSLAAVVMLIFFSVYQFKRYKAFERREENRYWLTSGPFDQAVKYYTLLFDVLKYGDLFLQEYGKVFTFKYDFNKSIVCLN